ncbi:extracellular solute-binding protein [Brassicibacter mesophilus]|uniref:extracellular solute-binding protein n=1 Tax=Brassicibacter mesophilus TaxID=745119 RepID=UPI003D1DD59A
MKYKKIIVLMLILSLMITSYGCTQDKKTSDTNVNDLSYKEIILSDTLGEEYISSININSKSELVLCSEGDKIKYLILDEKGEIKKEISLDFDGRADLFTINNENSMYILSQIPKRNENKDIVGLDTKLLSYNNEENSINEDNIIAEISDNTARTVQDMTIKVKSDSKGNIYALKLNGSIEVYDNNLKSKKIIDSVEYWDIQIDEEDNLFALHKNFEKKALEKIDTNNYKTIWIKEYKDTDAPESIYYNKNTKSLYGINANWIVKYDSQGNMINRILNTGELSIIEYIIDFTVDDNEEIYIIAQNQDESNLIKYTKSEVGLELNKESEEEKTEIAIELWKDWGNFFANAAKKFEKTYPDIKITVKTNPDLDYKQYREKLNTELMAGKGTDILYLDSGNSLITYIEKDILVNLDDMIKKDKNINLDDYNKSIIDLSRYKDKLYTMPINYYQFYGFILNEKLLNEKGISLDDNMTWRDVYNLSESLNKNSKEKIHVLPKMQEELLFEQIIWQDIDYYLDKDKKEARFDGKEFINTLELFKTIKEDGIMHPEITWDHILQEYGTLETELNNIAICPGQIHAYHYINSFGAFFNNNFKVVSAPKGEYTGNRLFYSDFLSINTNSKYKEEAWEFIKFMLTEEIQTTNEGVFHVNNKANEKQIAEIFEFQEKYKSVMEKNKLYYVKEEDIKELDRIIENLNKSGTGDPFYDVIYKEIESFLKGEKTAEETAKMIQNKAEIYLLE